MITIIESPYAGEVEENLKYLRACMAHSFSRDEVPFASHGLYTQPGVLDDTDPAQRLKGMRAGFRIASALLASGEPVTWCFYVDRGWSNGMRDGLETALRFMAKIEFRSLAHDLNLIADAINIRRETSSKLALLRWSK